MIDPLVLNHRHQPIYRVVRTGWKHPLDASYSQRTSDRRWNTTDFPALYCCCATKVARAVVLDLYRFAGLTLDDLQPDYRPQMVEILWQGTAVDAASEEGLQRAALPADPIAIPRELSQARAAAWRDANYESIVCRSASLARLRYRDWTGDHTRWGEIALLTDRCRSKPRLRRRVQGLEWMLV